MNQNLELIKKLVDIGLSETETRIYLSMLSLGETTVMKISHSSGVKRSTIYPLIENLRNLGLVCVRDKGFKKVYVAENPVRLSTLINRKQEDLSSVLPALKSLYTLEGRDILIKTYEGVEAMKSVYDELLSELNNHDEYLVIGDPERWDNHAKDYFKKFIKKRLKIDLEVRQLLSYSKTAEEYKKFEDNFKEKIKILPKDYKIDSNVIITKNKVIMHQLDNLAITTVIETRSIVSLQKNLFEMLWAFCK
jgi:sugar-specific transcriptional regulator TrmB